MNFQLEHIYTHDIQNNTIFASKKAFKKFCPWRICSTAKPTYSCGASIEGLRIIITPTPK